MAIRNDFTAGEVLAAADLNDTFGSRVPFAYGTATPTTTTDGFIFYDENLTPPAPKFWDGSAFQSFGGGKILQIVHYNYSTEFTTTSGTPVDMGLSGAITPSSATSKILCIFMLQYLSQTTDLIRGLLVRNSTTILGPSRIANIAGASGWGGSFLDSPATTSAITYKIQVNKDLAGGTAFATNWANQQTSTLTLLEVSA